jgi:hypothetical protein
MKRSPDLELYQKYVVDMKMERTGLFDAVNRCYHPQTVLYPGCFVHITPSFYFPHVVYVDRNPDAQKFFYQEQGVLDIIASRCCYHRSPFMRFIAQDYMQPIPIMENSFDLLIALYAPKISTTCKQYLKPNGILLTNNRPDDDAAHDPELQLIAVIHRKGSQYNICEEELDKYFVPKPALTTRAHHTYGSQEKRYTHNADYYLFKRINSPSASA